eukprot:scaffold101584_cov46-Phaeocystis_antarctica.AAC.1
MAKPPRPEAARTCRLAPHRGARQHRGQRSPRKASTATAKPPRPEAARTCHLAPQRGARQRRSQRSS